MGDLLDEFRAYGYQGGMETVGVIAENDERFTTRNGHRWLTKDPLS
jgi:hypothetical protein